MDLKLIELLKFTERQNQMTKHIHILGASGSGTTTLGQRIEKELGFKHLDTDDFLWMPTNPPFKEIRYVDDRIKLLNENLDSHERWVLSGSLCGWGDYLMDEFDLVIYLRIPKDIRMKRLELREKERLGNAILEGNSHHDTFIKFMEWAALYDEGGLDIRSKALHYNWIEKLNCKVLRIEEDISLENKMRLIKEILD